MQNQKISASKVIKKEQNGNYRTDKQNNQNTLRDPKDRSIGVTQSEQQRENRLKNGKSIKNLWDNKRSNNHIIEVPNEVKGVWD